MADGTSALPGRDRPSRRRLRGRAGFRANRRSARGHRHENPHADQPPRQRGHPDLRAGYRRASVAHLARRPGDDAGLERGAERRPRRPDLGVHSRRQRRPHQGFARRHRGQRPEYPQRRIRFRPGLDRRSGTNRDFARTAKQPVRLRRPGRRDQRRQLRRQRSGQDQRQFGGRIVQDLQSNRRRLRIDGG